jgi:hypothetical protein
MTGRTGKPAVQDVTAIRGGAVNLAEAADAFLSSPRTASPNTRRAYAGVVEPPGRRVRPAPAVRHHVWRRDRSRAATPVGPPRPGNVEPQSGRRTVLADLVRLACSIDSSVSAVESRSGPSSRRSTAA